MCSPHSHLESHLGLPSLFNVPLPKGLHSPPNTHSLFFATILFFPSGKYFLTAPHTQTVHLHPGGVSDPSGFELRPLADFTIVLSSHVSTNWHAIEDSRGKKSPVCQPCQCVMPHTAPSRREAKGPTVQTGQRGLLRRQMGLCCLFHLLDRVTNDANSEPQW